MSAAAASRDITLVPIPSAPSVSLHISTGDVKKKNLINFLPICQPRSLKFHAMDTLHRHGYDLSSALSVLVPQGGPVLCRDEMEEWSSSEANLFEDALEKYGKDFNDIRQDFVSMHRKQGWGNN